MVVGWGQQHEKQSQCRYFLSTWAKQCKINRCIHLSRWPRFVLRSLQTSQFWKFSILQNSALPPWNTRQYKVTKALNFVLVSGCHWHVWHKPHNSPLYLCFPAPSFLWLFHASFSGLSLSCIRSTPYQEYIKTHTCLKFSVLLQGYNDYLPQLLTNTTKPSCWDRLCLVNQWQVWLRSYMQHSEVHLQLSPL